MLCPLRPVWLNRTIATPAPTRVTPVKPDGLFSSPERRNLAIGLLLIAATLAIYNPVSRHPFVNYDDDRYVTDNTHIRTGLHWDTVKWAFTSFDEANWHPLTWLSHAEDVQVFGMNPVGHHYVNLLWHALNVFLLFWVLWRATGAVGCSLMVAALFALHPINVESVAWVAERKSLLSMTFFLLALASYRWYACKPRLIRYLAVAALFACGLMSKPMVITLPFVLLLWDYWPLGRIQNHRVSQLLLEKTPILFLSAASAVITVKAQRAGDAIGSMTQYPASVRLGNALISYAQYLSKAFWPVHLAPMYPLHADSITAGRALAAAALLLAVTAVAVVLKPRPYLLVGWLWFVGTLVPMIGLVQVGRQAMADRYAYLPFVGLFIVICWGVAEMLEKSRNRTAILGVASALILSALAFSTHRQLSFWADNVSLWSHTIAVTRDNFIAEDNLGGALLERGRVDDAMAHFRVAAALEPSDPMSHLDLAADQQRQGHYSQAVEAYSNLVVMTRDARLRATAFTDLGYCYRELGDLDHARQSFQAAVSLRPRTLRAWVGLGIVDYKSGHYDAAVNDYSTALSIQTWDLGYYLLARAFEQAGRSQEGQAAMQRAMQTSENFADLRRSADTALAK